MLNILIVDDNADKTANIKKLIYEIPEINKTDIKVVPDIKSATLALLENDNYDLLLLDLFIPFEFGDAPSPEIGVDFLNQIEIDDDIKVPYHIIGITAHVDQIDEYQADFEKSLWRLIEYIDGTEDWKDVLRNKIEYLIKSKKQIKSEIISKLNFDVAIITALRKPELAHVLKLDINWLEKKYDNDDMTLYHIGQINKPDGGIIRLVAAAAPQMGMCAASVLSMKLIHKFRPKYLIMCGIAAGIKDSCAMGDILINEEAWDGSSGKISVTANGEHLFLPDPRHKVLDEKLKERFLDLKMSRKYLNSISENYTANKPDGTLNTQIGPLASVPAVIQNNKQIEEIQKHSRKLIGIEMESYGVFYSAAHCSDPKPKAISFKSVCDFANEDKNDFWQDYAAYTSANYMYQIIINELDL
tara:strand:- start:630 stop:1871 length:1242 start_codon:yes stop_codon:yes gene_type:complete